MQAHLTNVDISNSDRALCVVDAGSTLHAHACQVAQSAAHGAHVTSGGACTLTDCHVSRSTQHGACVERPGSRLAARGTTFANNGNAGVSVGAGAAADLQACVVEVNNVAGLLATVRFNAWLCRRVVRRSSDRVG